MLKQRPLAKPKLPRKISNFASSGHLYLIYRRTDKLIGNMVNRGKT